MGVVLIAVEKSESISLILNHNKEEPKFSYPPSLPVYIHASTVDAP